MDPSTITRLTTGQALVALQGELDLAESARLDDLFDSALAISPQLVVDFSAVTFADTTVLSALLKAHQSARDVGGGVAVVGANSTVERVLEITQLDQVFAIFQTMEHAGLESAPSAELSPSA